MTIAAVIGQVGCLTLAILLAALFAGIFLDRQFGTKPGFTLGLTIASIPVTLGAMIWVVRKATARFADPANRKADESRKEDKDSGTTA